MSVLYAIIMGVIQGVTEFLPVSSSGHLAVFQNLFDIEMPGLFFDVLLHVGTLVAVFLCFYRDIIKLFAELFGIVADLFRNLNIRFQNLTAEEKQPMKRIITNGYRKFDVLLIMATIPTAVIGIWDRHLVEKMNQVLLLPGICLIITGVILLLADRIPAGNKTPRNTTFSNAFLIGIAQGVATLPGISRSGSTLTACLGSGFKRSYAVRFTFILSIPAILGSLVFELFDVDYSALDGKMVGPCIIGMVVAAVVGFLCIRIMLVIVRRRKFRPFAIYCFGFGVAAMIAYFVKK